jgi:hypothetical protein
MITPACCRVYKMALKCVLCVTQRLHSWAFILEKWKIMLTQNPVHEYSQQLKTRTQSSWPLGRECLSKQTGAHSYQRVLLSNKKK